MNTTKIFVEAKPNAKEEKVQKVDETHFRASVKDPPIQGRANNVVIRLLSEYFHEPKANVKIVSGHTSKEKIVEIP